MFEERQKTQSLISGGDKGCFRDKQDHVIRGWGAPLHRMDREAFSEEVTFE